MRHEDLADVNCSVARTWSVVGDRWTMLVLRELFKGQRRFEPIAERLGIGRNVLAARLRSLTEEGVLERVPYDDVPVRHEYRLTAKGEALYPLLVALIQWGDTYQVDTPPVVLTHRGCGGTAEVRLRCAACDDELARRDVHAEFVADAW